MKLTAIFIMAMALQVSAKSYSQMISFTGKDVPLSSFFTSLEKQTGFSFFYNYALVKDIKPVTLDVKDIPMEEALKMVLSEDDLDFYLNVKTVFIIKKTTTSPVESAEKSGSFDDIKGRVINKQGEPMAGVTVTVKNSSRMTLTDEKGYFTFKNLPSGTRLKLSYTGFQSREIIVNGTDVLQIELLPADNVLDEAQVIAYGKTTQRYNVGDVTTIKAEDIEKQNVSNPILALQGRVPGLSLTQSNGIAGTGVTVRIQGINSLANGSDPLYIVDGVPYISQMISTLGGTILGSSGGQVNGAATGNGSPLAYINPQDIESVSILKDADATAIYGSRAANGAILITTKRGRVGPIVVGLNLAEGIGHIPSTLHMMNTKQYLEMRHEAERNDGITTPSPYDFDINGFWDTTRQTNWQKTLIGRNAQYTNLYGSISGGTIATKYLLGATYHRETSVFPGDFADQKGAVSFSLSSSSANERFHIQFSANYLIDVNHLPGTDLTSDIKLAPDAPALYNKDGSLNWMPWNGSSTWVNPLATNYNRYSSKVNNLISNMVLSYQILQGLSFRTSLGYSNLQQYETQTYPLVAMLPDTRPFNTAGAFFANSSVNSWIFEPQLTYERVFGKGTFNFLLGSTIQQNVSSLQQITGANYPNDLDLLNFAAATFIYPAGSVASIYKYNAAFGRANYIYDDKYIVDLTARRDGSSRFGSKNQFHDFGAVGIGWVFSKEHFFEHIPFISFGKIRASYGITGNDQIGDYRFLSLYNYANPAVPYQGGSSVVVSGLSNPYLKWETTKKLQIGLDLGLLNDRLLFNFTAYRNRSSSQLLNYLLPIITGFSTVQENFPALIQNAGYEFSITSNNIKSRNFSWTTTFNITVPRNKLLSFPNQQNTNFQGLVKGKSTTGLRALYRFAGVNSQTGEYQFYDAKGNLTYNPSYTDAIDTVNLDPRFIGGIENNIHLKGFELDFLVQFIKQRGQTDFLSSFPGSIRQNQTTNYLNRWKQKGDVAHYQRYNSNYSLFSQIIYAAGSNAAYGDASYIRLTNLSLSWELLKKWKTSMHLNDAKLFMQAQNLFVIMPSKHILNPETTSLSTLPPLRVVTLGVKANF